MTPIDKKNHHLTESMLPPISQEESPDFASMAQKSPLSNSPFAKMFPDGATEKELQGFIDNCLKMLIHDMKKADDRFKKSQKRLKQILEGKVPDSY